MPAQRSSSISRGGAKTTKKGQGRPSRDGLSNKPGQLKPVQTSKRRSTPNSSKAPRVNNRNTYYTG